MNRIIIALVSFLLTLFPNWGSMQYLHLQQTNDTSIAAPKIIAAIETHDTPVLEALMCKNIKDNVDDLPSKIGALLDAIEGATVGTPSVEFYSSFNGSNGDGRKIIQSHFVIHLTTTNANYRLSVIWETANNFAVQEVGIRGITISDAIGNPFVSIDATDGVMSWHY
jgi:hypothetical protein